MVVNLRIFAILFSMTSVALISISTLLYGISLRFNVSLVQIGSTLDMVITYLVVVSTVLVVQYLFSPYIIDWSLGWAFNSRRFKYTEFVQDPNIPLWVREYLIKVVEKTGIGLKRVTILNDFTMNAFVYGHGSWNGRLVITKGMFKYLSEAEFKAVIAHEVGHVKHNDFILITLASGIPLISASVYSYFRQLIKRGRQIKLVPLYFVLAVVNYALYMVSMLMLLAITRARESQADLSSIELGCHPYDISMALAKIGYGALDISPAMDSSLLTAYFPDIDKHPNEFDSSENAKRTTAARSSKRKVVSTLGFAPAPTNMNYMYTGEGTDVKQRISKVLNYERKHPMSRFIQLFMSHPMVSKRIAAMDELAVQNGIPPLLDLTPSGRQRLTLPHIIDAVFLLINYLPLLLLPAFPAVLVRVGYLPEEQFNRAMAIIFAFLALYYMVFHRMKYPRGFKEYGVIEIAEADIGHPVFDIGVNRRKAVTVRGTVLGRLTPGFILGDDFVINSQVDGKSQNLVILWDSLTGALGDLLFALRHLPEIEGKEVTIDGWLARMPAPVLIAKRVKFEGRWKTWSVTAYKDVGSFLLMVGLFVTSGIFLLI